MVQKAPRHAPDLPVCRRPAIRTRSPPLESCVRSRSRAVAPGAQRVRAEIQDFVERICERSSGARGFARRRRVRVGSLYRSQERIAGDASGTASRGHHPVRAGSAGRQRACLARREGQRDHRRRPRRAHPVETASAISETNFSLLAWEARTAQQMWGAGEAEAKYDIRVNCYLYGNGLRAGSRWGMCEQTPECRREHRRSPAR